METISTGTVTMQGISSPAVAAFKNPGDVDFEVKYPKDYKGEKYMPEGVVTVSKESAEQFTKMGIGQVVEAKPTETVNESKVPAPKADYLISLINGAESAEAIDALLPEGEERKTVLAAVEARKKQLSENQ